MRPRTVATTLEVNRSIARLWFVGGRSCFVDIGFNVYACYLRRTRAVSFKGAFSDVADASSVVHIPWDRRSFLAKHPAHEWA